MKLSYELLTEMVEVDPGRLICLTIEHLAEFRKILEDLLYDRIIITFFEESKVVEGRFIEVVDNIYKVDLNDKKILSKVMKTLESLMEDDSLFSETQQLNLQINEYVNQLIFESDLPLDFDQDISKSSLLKAIGIRVREDATSLIERIIDYLALMLQFSDIKIFCFINLKLFLDNNEFDELTNFASQQDIIILDLERIFLKVENKQLTDIIIDSDLCRVK